jgi:hypothetical protein
LVRKYPSSQLHWEAIDDDEAEVLCAGQDASAPAWQ